MSTGEIDTRFSFCAVATLALLVCISCTVFLKYLSVLNTQHFITNMLVSEDDSQASLPFKGKMDTINVDKAVEFVLSCMNFDGGFGCRPGSESHAGQVSPLI